MPTTPGGHLPAWKCIAHDPQPTLALHHLTLVTTATYSPQSAMPCKLGLEKVQAKG